MRGEIDNCNLEKCTKSRPIYASPFKNKKYARKVKCVSAFEVSTHDNVFRKVIYQEKTLIIPYAKTFIYNCSNTKWEFLPNKWKKDGMKLRISLKYRFFVLYFIISE